MLRNFLARESRAVRMIWSGLDWLCLQRQTRKEVWRGGWEGLKLADLEGPKDAGGATP